MKRFFKILRKTIKIFLWLILGIIIIITIGLVIINNRTLKFFEDEDYNTKFTIRKDFKVKEGTEITLNLWKGTIIENEIYDGEVDNEGITKINLKKGIITFSGINFEDSGIPGGYIESQDIIKIKKINFKDIKQAYKNGDIKNWFEILRFFVDGQHFIYFDNGQIYKKQNYINWLENGYFTEYYKNGQIKEEGNYENGNQIGTRTGYYENGNIMYIGNYINGFPDGISKGYFENGSIKFIYNFKNGFFNGKSFYYQDDGTYADITAYNGVGIVIIYDKNNNIKIKYGFSTNGYNMVFNGNYVKFFENGNITELNYKNGKYDGFQTGYYKDGSIRFLGNFENGSGIMSYFDVDGNLIGTGEKNFINQFEYGRIIQVNESKIKGLDISLHDSGQIKEISNYSGGELYGIQKIYYENGNLRYIGEYKTEKMGYTNSLSYFPIIIGKFEYFGKDGILIGTGEEFCSQMSGDMCIEIQKTGNIEIIQTNPTWIIEIYEDVGGLRIIKNRMGYYENGNLEFVQNFNDGKLDGISIHYYENGQIKKELFYKNGNLTGIQTGYYENGKIMEKGNYVDGEENGYRVEYFEDGNIYSEGNYDDGKRVGTWNRYLGDGSIGVSKNYDE